MDRTLVNIARNFQQYSLVLVAIVFVLLTSCPVKSGIKSLVGLPVNTEQEVPKGKHDFVGGSNAEKCVIGQTNDTTISNNTASHANSLLPAVFLIIAFLSLPIITSDKEQSHPLYGNIKIRGTLPIFIQYRKLII